MVSAVPLATMYFGAFAHRPMPAGVTPAPQTVSPNFPPSSVTMIVPASFDAAPPAPTTLPPAPELVPVDGFPPEVAPPPAPLVVPEPEGPPLAVVPVPLPVELPDGRLVPPDSPWSEQAVTIVVTT